MKLCYFWRSLLASFRGSIWYHFGGSKGEPKFNSFLDPSRTPRELSTPIVYNPHFALQPLLLLREFDDFNVFAKNSHFKNINFAWYLCRFRPYPKSTGATKKHLNPSTTSIEKARCKSRTCMVLLSNIYVFKVPRRSGAFSRNY